jgi:hypothetical protein
MRSLRHVHRTALACRICAGSLVWMLYLAGANAQALPTASSKTDVVVDGDSGIPKPLERGFSLSSAMTVSHDSLSGWSTLESPALSYRFSDIFSVDASVPYYAYVNAVRTTKTEVTRLVGHTNVLGDTAFSAHAEAHPRGFDYIGTVAMTVPTGDQQLGLSTGRVSYDVNSHLEHDFSIFTPDVEAGIGDTSGIFRQQIRKNYTSSGELLFFQAGSSVDLPALLSLDVEGYEQLPIGSQTVFSRTVRKNGTVLEQASSAEDNGVSAELNATLMKHLILAATYNRSVRLDDSTEGISLTFLMHIPPNGIR